MPGFCFETFKSCLGEFLLSSGCFAEASSNASGLNHSIHGRRIPTAGALSSSLVLVTGDAHSGTKSRWLAYRAMVLRDDMAPVEDDDRAVTVTCSTENLGRDKLVLVSCGIDLTHYCANPICLWQHNADGLYAPNRSTSRATSWWHGCSSRRPESARVPARSWV